MLAQENPAVAKFILYEGPLAYASLMIPGGPNGYGARIFSIRARIAMPHISVQCLENLALGCNALSAWQGITTKAVA